MRLKKRNSANLKTFQAYDGKYRFSREEKHLCLSLPRDPFIPKWTARYADFWTIFLQRKISSGYHRHVMAV